MSDQTETPTEEPTVDAPQDEATETPTVPPWGEDFDPARAWNTITNLRTREKELEADAKQFQRLASDETALRDFLTERGYEFDDDDPDPPAEDTPQHDPRLDQHEQVLAEIQAERAQAQFDRDLDEELAGRELNAKARKWITTLTLNNGADRDALHGAVDEWFEMNPPPAPKRPKAPHTPQGGPPTEEYRPKTREERNAQVMARVQAEQA